MSPLDTIEQLRGTLEAIAQALVQIDLKALLETEERLATALSSASGISALSEADRTIVRAELQRARTALVRCRTMGVAIQQVSGACLNAQDLCADYDRTGATAMHPPHPAAVEARV